jgi:hypothetical protein
MIRYLTANVFYENMPLLIINTIYIQLIGGR